MNTELMHGRKNVADELPPQSCDKHVNAKAAEQMLQIDKVTSTNQINLKSMIEEGRD